MVIPTGVYIPQMVELDLLEVLNLDLIPNFENVDEIYRDQPWDPGNKYSVCKDWGSTGWIYDKTKVSSDDRARGTTSSTVAQGEASGQTSVLDTPGQPDRHLFLGERHPVDDDGRGRPRCVRGLHRQRARPAYQGLRLVPGDRAHRGQVRALARVERRRAPGSALDRRARPLRVGTRGTGDRALDGQLVHREGRASTRTPPTRGSTTSATRRSRSRTSRTTATTPGSWASRRRRRPPGSSSSTSCSSPTSRSPRWTPAPSTRRRAVSSTSGTRPRRPQEPDTRVAADRSRSASARARSARADARRGSSSRSPAWLFFIFFFAVPVLFIFWYSFGYKPDIFRTIATDQLSFDRYGESFSATFRDRVQRYAPDLDHRHDPVPADRVPVRVLARRQGAATMARAPARPHDRARSGRTSSCARSGG